MSANDHEPGLSARVRDQFAQYGSTGGRVGGTYTVTAPPTGDPTFVVVEV